MMTILLSSVYAFLLLFQPSLFGFKFVSQIFWAIDGMWRARIETQTCHSHRKFVIEEEILEIEFEVFCEWLLPTDRHSGETGA
jgi:hypothetical protein